MAEGSLVVSVPHAGLLVPAGLSGHSQAWTRLRDTDWHVDRLARASLDPSCSLVVADYSRYVIDLNRPADDKPLYPGAGTSLVPTDTFASEPLYAAGQEPTPAEREQRRQQYWQPYHDQLRAALDKTRQRHGFAVLLDLHSIASRVPRLFEGRLPDLNLGTFDGRSCDPSLEAAVTELLASQNDFSWVVNGRFKGGYITRHYGQPSEGVHALQLEIAQACYMDESDPMTWSAERAAPLVSFLKQLLAILQKWQPR